MMRAVIHRRRRNLRSIQRLCVDNQLLVLKDQVRILPKNVWVVRDHFMYQVLNLSLGGHTTILVEKLFGYERRILIHFYFMHSRPWCWCSCRRYIRC